MHAWKCKRIHIEKETRTLKKKCLQNNDTINNKKTKDDKNIPCKNNIQN